MRAMPKKREQVVDRMVKIAGGERAFERTLIELSKKTKGGVPTGRQLLRAVVETRIEAERAKLAKRNAEMQAS